MPVIMTERLLQVLRSPPPAYPASQKPTRHDLIQRSTPAWADLAAIAAKYREAEWRTRRERRRRARGYKWSVDHIVPLRHPLVSGLHVPDNLQVIRAHLNSQKHNTFAIE
jgi:hypothetical protein